MVAVLVTIKSLEVQIEKALTSVLSITTFVVSAAILGCNIVHTQVRAFLHDTDKNTSMISDKNTFFIL